LGRLIIVGLYLVEFFLITGQSVLIYNLSIKLDTSPNYNIEKAISNWILTNCKSRFYVGKNVTLTDSNEVASKLRIGFEDPKELSYFALACPHLKYK